MFSVVMEEAFKIELDRPINAPDQDKLYYSDLYAVELEKILDKTEGNSVKIGLFSKFGSGKTSAMNLLKQRLKNRPRSLSKKPKKLFIYVKSIWNYSPEDTLKKILVEVDKQGKLNLKYDEINTEKVIIDKKVRNINLFLFILLAFLAICIVWIISYLINPPKIILDLIIGLITAGLGLFFAIDAFKRQTRKPPATSYDFEEYWDRIFEKATAKNYKHITLVIDDLDRCKPDIVNGILGKLHTVIEKTEGRQCTLSLIIPFSLADYFTLKSDPETEMLRHNYKKFFDIMIDMPDLDTLELQRLS